MGVPLAGAADSGPRVVDPEALICFTAALGDANVRLREESMDWCIQFGARLVSTSRLRNVRKLFAPACDANLDRYFSTVNGHGPSRWPVLDAGAGALQLRPSGKSRLPRLPDSEPLLRLQLRALFGVTARAEVLLALSSGRSPPDFLAASELTSTGYSKRNIALVLEDLALCELLSTKRIANRVGYRLQSRAHLSKLAPAARTARLVPWGNRFALQIAALGMVESAENKSATLRSIEARRFVNDHAATLDALELDPPQVADPHRYFEDIVRWLLERVADPAA